MLSALVQLGSASARLLADKASASQGRSPLAAYPVIEASLARAERSGILAAEKRRLIASRPGY